MIALKIDEEFEWKLNCSSKNDMRNLAIFYQSTSFKIGTLMTSLCLNSKMYELKVYRKVMRHDNEEWSKMWRGIDLSVQNWHEEFDEFWPEHSKISKICTLMGCFWPKYIMFELKKSTEELCLMTLKIDPKIWRKTDLCFLKWHEEFGKFSFTGWKIAISF